MKTPAPQTAEASAPNKRNHSTAKHRSHNALLVEWLVILAACVAILLLSRWGASL